MIEYSLDGKQRRVYKEKTSSGVTSFKGYIYDGAYRIAAEFDDSGAVVKEYISVLSVNSADYMIEGTDKYFFIKDHLGSPRLVVNATTGSVAQEMEYTEFGEVVVDTNAGFQPYGFAGGVLDQDTRLTKFGARDYDAETGRWTSKDPILFNGGDTNLYGYVLADPVNFVDPSGLLFDGAQDIGYSENGAAAGDFAKNYLDMIDANTKGSSDKYFHCLANCQAASRGARGKSTAKMLSNIREFIDQLPPNADSAASCAADQVANQRGRDGAGGNCKSECSGFVPRGLPMRYR